jgi:peptidoglycan/xylan/chitin deacetylase (PgdA/CDA1 family)
MNPVRKLGDRFSRGWQARRPMEAVRALGAASKPWLRDGLAEALSRLGATAPERFARGALTIVTFHRVLPQEKQRLYPIPGLVVTPEQLKLVLAELAQHFECGTVIEGFRRFHAKNNGARARDVSLFGAAPKPLLAISFDDGALDNYEHARPVLAELGLLASFYIPVNNVEERRAPWHDRLGFALMRSAAAARKGSPELEQQLLPFGTSVSDFDAVLPQDLIQIASAGVAAAKKLTPGAREAALEALEKTLGGDQVPDFAGLMSWDQIRQLHLDGHEIGSHSLTHPLLPDLPDARVQEEVEGSRRELSRIIGADVRSFCYPNGSYDARTLRAVGVAGYECAVTTTWGLNRKQPPFELARCDMDFARLESRAGGFSPERLWLRLSGLQPGLAASGSPAAY